MATGAFVVILACAALLRADQASQQQTQPPQFSTAVDVVRMEVTVLDERTRQPIRGLTTADFEVRVNGVTQPVSLLTEVVMPERPSETVAHREAAIDVTSNHLHQPRLFVIVMNDASGGIDPFDRRTGLQVAHAVVDELTDEDLAAVVFVRDNRHAQDFTSDRTLLRRAIDRYNPMDTIGTSPFGVLVRAREFLLGMPGYRRAVVFISSTIQVASSFPDTPTLAASPDPEGLSGTESLALRRLAGGATVTAVPLYAFSTNGLHAPTEKSIRGGLRVAEDRWNETLLALGSASGGRAIVAHNAPATLVPAVMDELSSYYLLAYTPTYPLDGGLRRLSISVKRPGMVVVPSNVVTTSSRATARPTPPTRATAEAMSASLSEALSSPVSAGALPLRLSVLPFAAASGRESVMAVTVGLPAPEGTEGDSFTIRTFVFDGEGRRPLFNQTQAITVSATTEGHAPEVAFRLMQRPGRYSLRVVVERTSTKAAGSVHATVVIPDFADEPLSLSGVAIGTVASAAVAGREALADVLPFAPTTTRMFSATDQVGALLRVHQRTGRAQSVTMETRIVDASGTTVHTATQVLAPTMFEAARSVEHRFEMPLSTLGPGDYLLQFIATAGEHRAQRDVRFVVE